MPGEIYDECIRCPQTGEPLAEVGENLVSPSDRRYVIDDGIPLLYADETDDVAIGVTHRVREFYEEVPFPSYNDFDTIDRFVKKADEGVFARLLRKQLPAGLKVVEIGCGTGQLSNYLAATTGSSVYATDMTHASLRLGNDFARRNGINGVRFIQMNLFKPAISPESMDVLVSNGVLHNTYDPKKAFLRIMQLVKPGGYVILGLYNHIGRLRTDLRRFWVKLLGRRMLFLDPYLRKDISAARREAWIRDQYFHPQETKHSMSEMLAWFAEANVSFVSSVPTIHGSFTGDAKLFEPQDSGTAFGRLLAETRMLVSPFATTGGLFIVIGRKIDRASS
jgi:2-polyprenyl-3-methyl-5-hydroxy-6-metoxy-1,4-benzoquinol methylase